MPTEGKALATCAASMGGRGKQRQQQGAPSAGAGLTVVQTKAWQSGGKGWHLEKDSLR